MKNPLVLLSSLALAAPSHALDFTATFDPSATPQERAAIQGAMADWSSRITSGAHLNVAFVPDPTLGNTANSYFQSDGDLVPYATYKAALAAHAGSALDATAVGYLQATTGSSFGYLINNTNQAGGDEHASSSGAVDMTSALEKALGIVPSDTSDPDFTVYYNPDASRYDYDRSDGIDPNLRDFGGTIRCQIGQGMGFFSEVDDLDSPGGAGYDDADWDGYQTPLDLFRFETLNGVAQRSFTVGPASKSFSVDGGATSLGAFHTGAYHGGDGYAAGSFIESQGVFIRPLLPGHELDISALDLQAMDAMGWNLSPQAVPEPAALLPLGLGALALLRRRRERCRETHE